MSETLGRLTSGRLLARNGVINLAGQLVPMVLALVTIPILVEALGTARFGTLTLVWMVIGYFGVLDLGLGWALTQVVSEKLGAGREDEVAPVVWTTLAAIFLLGGVGTVLALAGASWLVYDVLDLRGPLAGEAVRAIRVLAFSLPFVATTGSMRGLLEARQRFGIANALRIPLAFFNFAAPLLVIPFSRSLVPIVAVLVAGRVVAWPLHLGFVLQALPSLRQRFVVNRAELGPLLRFGGWSTVSNVVSPLMSQVDRFLIGAMISVSAVAFYTTPYEVVAKMVILPAAIGGVVFPAFAASYRGDPERTARIFGRATRIVLAVLLPAALVVVALAREGLGLWLGESFAAESTRVAQILAVGCVLNGLAQMPFTLLQSVRRPHLTACLHLVELPLYLGVLWMLAGRYGIVGVAAAWTLRAGADAAALFWLAGRSLPAAGVVTGRLVGWTAAALVLLGTAAQIPSLPGRLTFLALALLLFLPVGWALLVEPEERVWMRARLPRRWRTLQPGE